MGATPFANGGRLLVPLDLPDFTTYAIDVKSPGTARAESTRRLGELLRDTFTRNAPRRNFRLFCPDETNSNRLGAVFEVEDRCLVDARPTDEDVSPEGRVMEVLSEHNCQGWLEGYLLTGRHGLFATYEAFAMVSASMAIQHAKWLEAGRELSWRAPVASLNVLLASTCWLRRRLPDLRVRVVNVADLMVLFPPDVHPHGMPVATFDELFTDHADVIVAFHGYARALHQILHGRMRPERFHVHGYTEEGTTTTPF